MIATALYMKGMAATFAKAAATAVGPQSPDKLFSAIEAHNEKVSQAKREAQAAKEAGKAARSRVRRKAS